MVDLHAGVLAQPTANLPDSPENLQHLSHGLASRLKFADGISHAGVTGRVCESASGYSLAQKTAIASQLSADS